MAALGDFVSTAAVILALLTAAGFGLQRGALTGLRERVNDQDGQITALKGERTDDKALIARQAADIAALQRIVTGEVHWQSISDMLEHHHKAAQEQWRRHEDLLTDIRDLLGRRS